MKLYYFETPNGRLPCSVAKYINAPIEYVHTNIVKDQAVSEEFKKLTPVAKVPFLADGDRVVWESKAIAAYIAEKCESDLFPKDERLNDIIRWFVWDSEHFSNYAAVLYYEHIIRPVFGKSARDFLVEHSNKQFVHNAQVLDQVLATQQWIVADQLSVVDFALSRGLIGTELAQIPYHGFKNIVRWLNDLNQLPAVQNPWPNKG